MTEQPKEDDSFEFYLRQNTFEGMPQTLYAPMNYIMQLGGKRMRPQLLLMAFESINGKINEDAFKLALAIETFHNFSLVHDDIMDHATLRRGKQTVHEKWNNATAILAGDNLLTKCYALILDTQVPNKEQILKIFTDTATQVCEGQQMDMDLPLQKVVNESDYLQMITYKTAVLPAAALQIGALANNSDDTISKAFYEYGLNLGMAFQLQDDYLDTFGTTAALGKQVGGDILENKKTILYLHAQQHLDTENKNILQNWFTQKVHDNKVKIEAVKNLYKLAGSDIYLLQLKTKYETLALKKLEEACTNDGSKAQFIQLFELIKDRIN